MIQALEDDFIACGQATDENSRAYRAVLKGVDPETCANTQSHVASRLLVMRFLDICKGLDKDIEIEINTEVVTREQPESVMKHYKVSFISSFYLNFWYHDTLCIRPFQNG